MSDCCKGRKVSQSTTKKSVVMEALDKVPTKKKPSHVCMTVVKRDNTKVDFNGEKIVNAILAAYNEIDGKITPQAKTRAKSIAKTIEVEAKTKTLTVEEIQDKVIFALMNTSRKDVAKAYCEYRYKRQLAREIMTNSTDDTILSIVDGTNEYWNSENSNKNPRLNTTVRDYMAGATSTDITRRILLPKNITEAHDEAILHFHDADYFIQHSFNCCLINIEDMLQNNTVISEVLIESPHTFSTACTVTTQIIAQVASAQLTSTLLGLNFLNCWNIHNGQSAA